MEQQMYKVARELRLGDRLIWTNGEDPAAFFKAPTPVQEVIVISLGLLKGGRVLVTVGFPRTNPHTDDDLLNSDQGAKSVYAQDVFTLG